MRLGVWACGSGSAGGELENGGKGERKRGRSRDTPLASRPSPLVNTLAKIGVILLLFEIGIEFSLTKLARLKRAIGLGGGL